MWCPVLVLLCFSLCFVTKADDSGLFISLSSGDLYGKTMYNYKSEKFRAFEGIPYAQPPLGELRFKSPKPVKPWEGLLHANKSGPSCLQFNHVGKKISGREDCLYLNVYTRMEAELNPVIVVIHHGLFVSGGGSPVIFGPEYLLSEEVVVVLFNYRLNIFGFLSFDDPTIGVPGNAGLKDMVFALKWIQSNIAEFGGDPNSVTILGSGSGGAAVGLLMASPLTSGLFHKAICQSGTGTVSYPFSNSSFRDIAFILHYGGDYNDQEKIYEFITSKKSDELITASIAAWNIIKGRIDEPLKIGAVIENSQDNEDPFLTDRPEILVENGNYNHVPLIVGFGVDEGAIKLFHYEALHSLMQRAPKIFVPEFINISSDDDAISDIGETIKKFYFKDNYKYLDDFDSFIEFFTDAQISYKAVKTAELLSKYSNEPVYFYEFNFREELFIKELEITLNVSEHMHDSYFIFKNRFLCTDFVSNGAQRIVLQRMIKLLTNFARYGNPTPELDNEILPVYWEPIGDSNNVTYLTIGVNLELKSNPNEKRIQFWKNLVESLSS